MDAESRYIQNEKLVFWVLHRRFPDMAYDEDIQQVARMGLWRACLYYDDGAGVMFSTYAVRAIHHAVCKHLDSQNCKSRRAVTVSLNAPIDGLELAGIFAGDTDVQWVDWTGLLSNLDPISKQIVKWRIAGHSQKEIGEKLGVSQASITRRLQRLRTIFDEYI